MLCMLCSMALSKENLYALIFWNVQNDWTISLQNKHSTTVAYTDFSRAFDNVSHVKLFARLYS